MSFMASFLHVLQQSNHGLAIPESIADLCDLFDISNRVAFFADKQVVLICDEIDSLGTTCEQFMQVESLSNESKVALERGRVMFLTHLLAMMNAQHNQYCLQSAIGITNCVGKFLENAIGKSPFNIQQALTVPYFTLQQVEDLATQWEQQEGARIDPLLTNHIFEFSQGAPGVVVMLFKYFVEFVRCKILGNANREPTFGEWYVETQTTEFWEYVGRYANYRRMRDVVSSPEIAHEIVKWTLKLGDLTDNTKNLLIKSNIIRVTQAHVVFANPLAEKVVNYTLGNSNVPFLSCIPLIGDSVDVVMLVREALKYMNRVEILSLTKPRKQNHVSSKYPESACDDVYVIEFNRVLFYLTRNRYMTNACYAIGAFVNTQPVETIV